MEIYKIGASASIKKQIQNKDIVEFSKISMDENPVHLVEEFAANTIFKKKIAHGLYIASLISAVIGNKLPGHGAIYLSQTLNFKKPVFIGDVIEAVVTVTDTPKPSILKLRTCCLNQNNEIVIDGEALVKY